MPDPDVERMRAINEAAAALLTALGAGDEQAAAEARAELVALLEEG